MEDKRICVECGAELPANAPQGLCPRCLLGMQIIKQGSPDHPDPAAAGHEGIFVDVGWNGVLLTSADGVHWTRRDPGVSAHLRTVNYSLEDSVAAK